MKIKIRSTFKKIFALILLFTLLLSASAFLTSFRTKEPTPYLTPPAGVALSPHLHISFETRVGSVVLLVDYSGARSSLQGVGKIQINITAEVDGQRYLLRSIGNYLAEFSGKSRTEELVIPAEYMTKDQGEISVHSEILVFLDRGSDACEVYTDTWQQLYKKVPGTISLTYPETKNEENEKNDEQAPPTRGFGCAAWRAPSDEENGKEGGNRGGGSSVGNGGQSAS